MYVPDIATVIIALSGDGTVECLQEGLQVVFHRVGVDVFEPGAQVVREHGSLVLIALDAAQDEVEEIERALL